MARTPSDPVSGLLDWAGSFAGGFGRRLVIHLCALIAAAITSASMNKMALPPMGTGAVVFTTYIGLICLIPRGRMQSMRWIVPTAAGFAQTLIWTIWGVPWQTTFLPAGLLTWGTRAITMKGDMGWEWSVLPWLLIGLYLFLDDLAPLSLYGIPYWTFPLLIAAAWGVLKVHRSIRFDAIHRDILKEAVDRLEELAGKDGLPDALRGPVRRLAEQGARFAQKAPRFDDAALALVLDYEKTTNALARLGIRSEPANDAVTALSARLQKLNDTLEQRLAPLTLSLIHI